MSGRDVTLTLSDELFEAIAHRAAHRAAELVRQEVQAAAKAPPAEWITAEQAAEILPYTIHHVWRLGRQGVLRTRHVGKYVRFYRPSVEALAAGERLADTPRRARSRPAKASPRRSTKRKRF